MITTIIYKGQEIKFEITDPEDYLQKFWLRGTFYELGMLQFIEQRWMDKNKIHWPVVVDIGACIGNHTIFFAKCMNAYVYAIEPAPLNMAILQQNAILNNVRQNIFPIQKGAGHHRGLARFKKDGSGNCGMGKITADGEDIVGLVPIDQVISPSHEVDIMKIDVEGYNLPVLKGAMLTIVHDQPDIYIECQTPEELREVEEFLLPLGYTRWPTPFNATPTYFFYY